MTNVQNAVDIGQSTDEQEGALPSDTMALVVQEVQNLLVGMEQSLQGICGRIEDASTKQELIEEFRPFDRIMRIFLEVEPDQEQEGSIIEAVSSLEGSTYLQGMLDSSASLGEAITGYKTAQLLLRISPHLWRLQEDRLASMMQRIASYFLNSYLTPSRMMLWWRMTCFLHLV